MTEPKNNLELKCDVDERKLSWIAKIHDLLAIWQGSQNLCGTQKESWAQHKQMTAVRYVSNTEEMVYASWSNFLHDGVAAFKLSKRSLVLPALFSTTAHEDEHKYGMSTELRQLTAIQLEVMGFVHQKAFATPKIDLTGMVTWIIQL